MLRSAFVLASLAPAAAAQFLPVLEISEVRVNPLPSDHQAIEVIAANGPLDTTGWHLAVGATTVPLPAVFVPPHGVFVLRLGVSGTSTSTNVFVPAAPVLGSSDSIALFRSALTLPSELLDYVAWGGASGPHAATAVQAGRWNAVPASATLPAAAGATLANRRITRSTGNLVGPDAWYRDTTPTLGAENDPAMTWGNGAGCFTPNAPTIGTWTQYDPGPWLGEPATLVVSPAPSFALLVLSTVTTPPIALDVIGMPLCFANVALDVTVVQAASASMVQFVYTLPVDPLLVGQGFYLQAFVPDPAAGNAIGAQVTPSVVTMAGWR